MNVTNFEERCQVGSEGKLDVCVFVKVSIYFRLICVQSVYLFSPVNKCHEST